MRTLDFIKWVLDTSKQGKNGDKGYRLTREGFEASTTRWRGVLNTIHVYYTEVSSPPWPSFAA